MGKLIVLRGDSGSGKTTVAKELQKKFGRNTILISQDVIRRDMLMVKDGEDIRRNQTAGNSEKKQCGDGGEKRIFRMS